MLLQLKAEFISQIQAATLDQREIEDVGEFTMDFAKMKALSSDNPLLQRRVEIETRLQGLSALRIRHERRVIDARADVLYHPGRIQALNEEIGRISDSLPDIEERAGKEWPLIVEGRECKTPSEFGSRLETLRIAYAFQGYVEDAGEIMGLRFDLEVDMHSEITAVVRMSHDTLRVVLPDSNKAKASAMKRRITSLERRVEQLQIERQRRIGKLELATAEAESVFDQEVEYQELAREFAEITIEIEAEIEADRKEKEEAGKEGKTEVGSVEIAA